MSRLDNGFADRAKLAIDEWLTNSNELAWTVIVIGAVLLVGLFMGR